MSNRFLWILIILWFIWAGYIYYNLVYLPELKANELRLINENNKIENEKITKEISLTKKDRVVFNKTNSEKIEEIIENNKNYKTFKLPNNKKAYFKKNNNLLDLYYDDIRVSSFEFNSSENLIVEKILWDNNDLYIQIWDNKFYFNSYTKVVKKINIKIEVLYVKESWINNLIFVTTEWSFNYNKFSEELTYFSYFNDYVNYKDWYIWIVEFNDYRILNNLWLESNNENLIIYYNSATKEKRVIINTLIDYKFIYFKNNKIFIESIEGELYELENF